ncbi:hypothetical protein K501DRAFT_272815 [Backusella circina FSU 941]|nr:hypothetical protein K501DRAFT_272815 [Backusella circina FSU 941]
MLKCSKPFPNILVTTCLLFKDLGFAFSVELPLASGIIFVIVPKLLTILTPWYIYLLVTDSDVLILVFDSYSFSDITESVLRNVDTGGTVLREAKTQMKISLILRQAEPCQAVLKRNVLTSVVLQIAFFLEPFSI